MAVTHATCNSCGHTVPSIVAENHDWVCREDTKSGRVCSGHLIPVDDAVLRWPFMPRTLAEAVTIKPGPIQSTDMPDWKLRKPGSALAEKYPAYYKDVRELSEVDVYMVHDLFQIDDPSGCLQHADKKILLSGVRTGGKPKIKDIREARDTLDRWLEIQKQKGITE